MKSDMMQYWFLADIGPISFCTSISDWDSPREKSIFSLGLNVTQRLVSSVVVAEVSSSQQLHWNSSSFGALPRSLQIHSFHHQASLVFSECCPHVSTNAIKETSSRLIGRCIFGLDGRIIGQSILKKSRNCCIIRSDWEFLKRLNAESIRPTLHIVRRPFQQDA